MLVLLSNIDQAHELRDNKAISWRSLPLSDCSGHQHHHCLRHSHPHPYHVHSCHSIRVIPDLPKLRDSRRQSDFIHQEAWQYLVLGASGLTMRRRGLRTPQHRLSTSLSNFA